MRLRTAAWLLTAIAALASSSTSASARMGPSVLMFYDNGLATPAFIRLTTAADLGTYGDFWGATGGRADPEPFIRTERPYYDVAMFWGPVDQPLESLTSSRANQHGRLYVGARAAPPAAISTDFVLEGPLGASRGTPLVRMTMPPPIAMRDFIHGAWLSEADIEIVEALGMQVRVPGTTRETQLIAEAEEGGRVWPRSGTNAQAFFGINRADHRPVPGTSERRCVDTAGSDAPGVRSGEIVAGNFGMYATLWKQGVSKIWWQPQFLPDLDARGWPGPMTLRVSADRLDAIAPSVSAVPSYSNWARGIVPSGDGPFFFPSGVMLPDPGKWLLVARGGMNWGCFVLSF